MKEKQTIVSLIQPTGDLHLGNYFGAIKNWVNLQDSNEYNCKFGVADYHAMTMNFNKDEFKNNVNSIVLDLISAGINPDKATLFIQSLVPEHTELYWFFNTLTSFNELSRMTQFKDKSGGEKEQSISNGLFSYPILQSADILIYKAHLVPVGEDQLQHVELTRSIAQRFNNRYGDFFPIPKPKITNVPRLMSLSNPLKKMSKSLGEKHYIGLFEDETSIRKKVKSAVTDTGEGGNELSPGVKNLFELLIALGKSSEKAEFNEAYINGTIRYKDLKDSVADALVELTKPFIERRKEVWEQKEYHLEKIYNLTAENRKIAQKTISEIREILGLSNRK